MSNVYQVPVVLALQFKGDCSQVLNFMEVDPETFENVKGYPEYGDYVVQGIDDDGLVTPNYHYISEEVFNLFKANKIVRCSGYKKQIARDLGVSARNLHIILINK